MSYNKRIVWKDHVVERPRTFSEVSNNDGTKTLNPAPGEVKQQGTPMSAKYFNTMEEAIQHIANAYDMMATSYQAEIRDLKKSVAALETKVTTLTS